jgi:hypothetical protein
VRVAVLRTAVRKQSSEHAVLEPLTWSRLLPCGSCRERELSTLVFAGIIVASLDDRGHRQGSGYL